MVFEHSEGGAYCPDGTLAAIGEGAGQHTMKFREGLRPGGVLPAGGCAHAGDRSALAARTGNRRVQTVGQHLRLIRRQGGDVFVALPLDAQAVATPSA